MIDNPTLDTVILKLYSVNFLTQLTKTTRSILLQTLKSSSTVDTKISYSQSSISLKNILKEILTGDEGKIIVVLTKYQSVTMDTAREEEGESK